MVDINGLSVPNMIDIPETIGGPTPSQVPLLTNKLLPNSDYLSPIPPHTGVRASRSILSIAKQGDLDYAAEPAAPAPQHLA